MNKNMRKMYSEQEIAELINKAIKENFINIGTKIYIHTITLDNDVGDNFVIITTTDKTPFISTELVTLQDEKILKIAVADDTEGVTYICENINFDNGYYTTISGESIGLQNYHFDGDVNIEQL